MIPLAPRLFVALLTLYLALDLAAPSLPGAFSFDVEDPVEIIREGVPLARSALSAPPAEEG